MGFRMAAPWRHPKTGIYWYRRGSPADLLRRKDDLSAIGIEVKREVLKTLGTKDRSEAQERWCTINADWERRWREMRTALENGPRVLSQKEMFAIVAEMGRDVRKQAEENPGHPETWYNVAHSLEEHSFSEGARAKFKKGLSEHVAKRYGWPAIAEESLEALLTLFIADLRHVAADLKRLASGDYRPPEWLEARPKAKDTIARPSSKHRAKVSFESIIAGWSREVVPKPNTVRTYESRLKFFTDVIGHRDASRVTSHDVRRWRDEMLEDGKLSRETIRDRLAAVNALLQWAVENEMLAENIAKDVKLRKRGAEGTRRTKREFTEEEAKLILRNARKKTGFLRWAPWIMAYTGMRVGEVAQLRRVDVVADGDGGLHLTVSPEAGNVKTGVERTIPVHPALIAEGFAEFANVGKTERLFPEFYRNLSKPRPPEDIAKAASYKMVRWLRGKEGLGITDLSISPSHSWRHFFNTLSRDAELDLEVRKAMVGHMDNKTAEGYGSVRMTAKRKQIEKLPAVKVD